MRKASQGWKRLLLFSAGLFWPTASKRCARNPRSMDSTERGFTYSNRYCDNLYPVSHSYTSIS
jgi:hypothetical protein